MQSGRLFERGADFVAGGLGVGCVEIDAAAAAGFREEDFALSHPGGALGRLARGE